MDAISAWLGTLYSVLLGVGVLGSCLPLGSEGSTWDTGGAAAAFVVGVGLLLAWLAVVPQRHGWVPAVAAGTAFVGAFVVAAVAGEGGTLVTGAQLLVISFFLVAVVTAAHAAVLFNPPKGLRRDTPA